MNITIIGSNGQLGADILQKCQDSGFNTSGLTHEDIQIEHLSNVQSVFNSVPRPNIVINTAAMHNVEACEQDPEMAFAVNVEGSRNLALACNDLHANLVHISTDYVFGNEHLATKQPYTENDIPSPLNVYGNSKLLGEKIIQSNMEKYYILRTSGLYGTHPCRAKNSPNFVELMLKLGKEREEVRVVSDEFLTPTSTQELAQQIIELIQSDHYGLYHATCEGMCSWYEFAQEIFRLAKLPAALNIAGPDEFPMKTPRPEFSVLENKNLKKEGLNIFSPWQEALKQYLNK